MNGIAAGILLLAGALAPGTPGVASADGGDPFAHPLEVSARALPDKVKLGEPFIYELVVTHGKDQRYELRTPTDLGAFELLEQARSRVDLADKAITTFKLKMALFELGAHPVPDLTFDVAMDSSVKKFVAKGPPVEGLGVLPKDAEKSGEALADIKPTQEVPVRSYRLLWGVLGAFAVAALAYAFYRYLRRPKLAPRVPVKPPDPLDVRTLAALRVLREQNLPAQGKVREYYFRLSEILRGYLGERYGFDALECTTPELWDGLQRRSTPHLPLQDLRRFLDESDMVKFAKAEIGPDGCKEAMEFGHRLVSLTTPLPQPPASLMLPDNLTFNNPHVLWALVLVPAVLWWSWFVRRKRAVLRFSAAHVFATQRKGLRPYLLPLLPLLRAAAVFFAVVALARPQARDSRTRDSSVEGIDIVVALDLSTSMEAGDFRPQNRVFVAKQVLKEFLSSRVNDRIGLVVFAGQAYTQAPLTLDYNVLKEVVDQLRTRVLEDGTAMGDALAISLNRLRESEAKSRVIVLITDGDNNAGKISPLDAAAMAKALGIKVFTILVGKGGKVPFPAGTDLFGNTAWREMEIAINPQLLQDIADTTGGEYYRATDRDTLKEGLQKVLDALERSKLMEGGASANYREEYFPYLLLAFWLAVLELVLGATVLKVFP